MNKEKMAAMSGENEMGQAPKLVLNQLKINGAKGQFIIEHCKEGLIEVDGKKKYRQENIGTEADVVFLKIRRKLVQFRKGKKSLMTSEHNHPGQKVILYGDTIEKGVASELRQKYPSLRTQQVVYALYKGELVRVFVKGASLGSDSKPKDMHDFYSYVASFKDKGKDEHFYEYHTTLKAVEESGDLGNYYTIDFQKGDQLAPQQMEEVEQAMTLAFDHCEQSDKYYLKFFVNDILPKENSDEDIETVEYPENDKEEIPF